MNKKKIILAVAVLLIIVIVGIVIVVNIISSNGKNANDGYTIEQTKVEKQTILKTLTSSAEVSSGLIEKVELHATYYFSELYVDKNAYIKEGDNILKYTNGTYLKAPYDCVLTSYSLPDAGGQCKNSHYVELKTTETLCMPVSIDETEMGEVSLGQEVDITINAFSDKGYKGLITNIDESGTYKSGGSSFTATVTFLNDGNIKLGMSASCTVTLEEAKDVIGAPVAAVEEKNGIKYVTVINGDGTTKDVEVEIGLSNANYVEIKSGLLEGEIVQYVNTATGKAGASSTSSSAGNSQSSQSTRELMRAVERM